MNLLRQTLTERPRVLHLHDGRITLEDSSSERRCHESPSGALEALSPDVNRGSSEGRRGLELNGAQAQPPSFRYSVLWLWYDRVEYRK